MFLEKYFRSTEEEENIDKEKKRSSKIEIEIEEKMINVSLSVSKKQAWFVFALIGAGTPILYQIVQQLFH